MHRKFFKKYMLREPTEVYPDSEQDGALSFKGLKHKNAVVLYTADRGEFPGEDDIRLHPNNLPLDILKK